MFINSKTLSLTLIASLLTLASANDFAAPRREHDSLKRLIRKKRAPADLLEGLANVVPNPNATNTTDPNASASASAASNSALPSASDSALPSASDSASLSQSASQSASLSQSSQSSASQSQPASKTKEPEVTPTPDADDDNAPGPASLSTITNLASAVVAAATAPPGSQSGAVSEKKSTITTILIVVAASVGGVAILWTVFRKWKLGASKKFDSRMGPIDWQPSNDDNGIVPAHRLARTNSYASSVHASSHGHGAGGYRDPLEHDFTAAPSHLAPVGGYADLTRGPSPQPQMQETLTRGPSLTNPNPSYGAAHSGVPLHHQAGYGNAEAYDYNGNAVRF